MKLNRISLFLLLFQVSALVYSQDTFFNGMRVKKYDSISEVDKNILTYHDSIYNSCTTDSCKLNALYGAGNTLQSVSLQKSICEVAIVQINEFIRIAGRTKKLSQYEIKFLGGLGMIYLAEGDFSKSIHTLKKSLEAAKKIKDTILIIENYNNLGYINYVQEDFSGANQFYLEAIDLAESTPSLYKELPELYLNIIVSYCVMDSIGQAQYVMNKLSRIDERIIKKHTLLIIYNNSAKIYSELLKKEDSAMVYYTKTIKLAEELNDIRSIYIAKGVQTKLYLKQGKLKLAEKVAMEILPLCKKLEDEKLLADTYKQYFEIKKKLGKFEEALEYKNLEIELKEKLRKKEDVQALSDLKANLKYESQIELNKEKNESLAKESQLKSNIIYLSLGFLTLLGLALVLVIINRRKLNQSRIKLEELDKVNKQIFSVIAHDFKEPIISFNLLLSNISNKKTLDGEFVDELESQIKSSSAVLNNLLNWARVELEKQEVVKTSLNLNELWNKVVSTMEASIKKKNIAIKNIIAQGETIKADAVMMEIVFRNLLSNAIKFSPEGGEITLRSTKSSIEIIDEGEGINTTDKNSLFKEKVNPVYGTKGEIGFGIGLFIVKNLLKKNGKGISFTNNNPKGTIFSIQDL